MASAKCINGLVEAVLCIAQADDKMLDIYGVVGLMALKITICDIVHHAIRIIIWMNTDFLVHLVMIGLAQELFL